MTKKLRVVLLFGGRSGEHEVSCVSARHVAEALDPDRYEVVPVGITKEGRWMLPQASKRVLEGARLQIPDKAFEASGDEVKELVPVVGLPDVVLPMLHGPYGEDGTVQGLLELADIPYVGAGVLGSALGMDKEKMKILLRSAGLPTTEFVVIRDHEWEADPRACMERAAPFGFPLFAKPANLGSSVGITKCFDSASLEAGIEVALQHDRKVVVEESVPGRELECGVLGNEDPEASVCGEVVASREFYDYVAKYIDEGSRTIIPADIPDEICETVRSYSIRAFKAIDAEGMARVDFFYDEGGSPARGVVVNEINTIPGFTNISMYPKLWEASGVPYDKLLNRLIELAIQRHAKKRRPRGELPGTSASG